MKLLDVVAWEPGSEARAYGYVSGLAFAEAGREVPVPELPEGTEVRFYRDVPYEGEYPFANRLKTEAGIRYELRHGARMPWREEWT